MGRLRELLLVLRQGWHLPTILVVVGFIILDAYVSIDPLDIERHSGEKVVARITSISSIGNKFQGPWPGLHVVAQANDGSVGAATALPVDLKGCKVGDVIPAERSGLRLYLKPRPCASH